MAWSWIGAKKQSGTRPRVAQRHEAVGLHAPPFGDLVDLSATGMKLNRVGKPDFREGDAVPLVIQNDSQCVRVQGQVVWVRRVGLKGGYEVGIKFMDVRPGVAMALDQFARFGHIETKGANAANGAAAPEASDPGTPHGATPTIKVEVEDLYIHLGLHLGASDAEVRSAYHELAKKWHPDHCREEGAAEKFALLSKSYKVLRNSELREKYDQMLRSSRGAA
jgi:hypothetical protein